MKTTIGPFTITTRRFDQRSAYTRYTISVRVDGEDVVLREQVSFVGAQECLDALNKAVERSVISADDAMDVLTDAGAMGVIPQPLPSREKEMHSRIPSTNVMREFHGLAVRVSGMAATGFDRGRAQANIAARGAMHSAGGTMPGSFRDYEGGHNAYAS